MKANELMIGNYVKDPYGKEIRLVSVDADASMLTPIQLTEEWLLSFGFELTQYDFFDEDGEDEIYLEFTKKLIDKEYTYSVILNPNGVCEFCANYRWTESGALIATIQNVHQLQNLYFALTKEWLNLKTKQK